MKTQTKYSPGVRERAVRLVLEHQSEYESQWAAMEPVTHKIGCTAETLRKWVRQRTRKTQNVNRTPRFQVVILPNS